MKKLLVIALVASVIATSAFAKTEGNYVGLNFVQSYFKMKDPDSLTQFNNKSNDRTSTPGVGLSYKYAFNKNNFFAAPGVYFDYNRVRLDKSYSALLPPYYITGLDVGGASYRIPYTYGVRVDLGYDIDEKVSLYAIVGEQAKRYDIEYQSTGTVPVDTRRSNIKIDLVYGVGTRLAMGPNTSLNLEYLTQTFKARDVYNNKVKMNLDTFKIGLVYNFSFSDFTNSQNSPSSIQQNEPPTKFIFPVSPTPKP